MVITDKMQAIKSDANRRDFTKAYKDIISALINGGYDLPGWATILFDYVRKKELGGEG